MPNNHRRFQRFAQSEDADARMLRGRKYRIEFSAAKRDIWKNQ